MPSLTLAFRYALANCPGKSAVGVVVDFGSWAATPPHRHGGASVAVYVLEGAVVNAMNDEPAHVVQAGGSWYEAPGCHHRVSDNCSAEHPARLLAVFVVDTVVLEEGGGLDALVEIDEEYRDMKT